MSADLFRRLRVKLQNLVLRGVVTRSGPRYQVQHLGDRVHPDMELFQPQGVHFQAPVGSEGMLLAPAGETSSAVFLGAHKRSALPSATLADGEGGLHFLGTYAVYIAADGKVHLGGGTAASDFVALAAKVTTELGRVKDDFTALKTAIGSGFTAVGAALAASGAAGKSAFDLAAAAVPSSPASVAATKVKAT